MARPWWRRRDPHAEWRRPPNEPADAPDAQSQASGGCASLVRRDEVEWREEAGELGAPERDEASTTYRTGTPEGELLPPVHEAILAAEDLVRSYGGRGGVTAVRGVSFEVRPREFVALMGPSGSGKTTLLGLLAGLDHPEEGVVRWRGRPLEALSHADALHMRRRAIGMVFQSFGLLPTLSALENVELPLRIAGARLDRARRSARNWLERLGLEDRLDNRTFELSAGQQQRVAVARALVIEPDVVLADEPIAEVDTENADLILDALADVVRRGGAVVAATHNPQALAYSTRVVLLRDGRVEGAGAPDDVAPRLSVD